MGRRLWLLGAAMLVAGSCTPADNTTVSTAAMTSSMATSLPATVDATATDFSSNDYPTCIGDAEADEYFASLGFGDGLTLEPGDRPRTAEQLHDAWRSRTSQDAIAYVHTYYAATATLDAYVERETVNKDTETVNQTKVRCSGQTPVVSAAIDGVGLKTPEAALGLHRHDLNLDEYAIQDGNPNIDRTDLGNAIGLPSARTWIDPTYLGAAARRHYYELHFDDPDPNEQFVVSVSDNDAVLSIGQSYVRSDELSELPGLITLEFIKPDSNAIAGMRDRKQITAEEAIEILNDRSPFPVQRTTFKRAWEQLETAPKLTVQHRFTTLGSGSYPPITQTSDYWIDRTTGRQRAVIDLTQLEQFVLESQATAEVFQDQIDNPPLDGFGLIGYIIFAIEMQHPIECRFDGEQSWHSSFTTEDLEAASDYFRSIPYGAEYLGDEDIVAGWEFLAPGDSEWIETGPDWLGSCRAISPVEPEWTDPIYIGVVDGLHTYHINSNFGSLVGLDEQGLIRMVSSYEPGYTSQWGRIPEHGPWTWTHTYHYETFDDIEIPKVGS